MLKRFSAYLILLSMLYYYYDFFNWYLSGEQLQIEKAFSKGATAFIVALVFIVYIHIVYFPKLIMSPVIPTFPPLIMLFSLNIGLGVGITNLYLLQLYQLPIALDPLRSPVLGVGIIIFSFILIYFSVGVFRQNNEDPNPTTVTNTLITSGIFKHIRNPMYLSLTLFQFGVGIALSFLHISLMSFVTGILLHFFVILREENYLKLKFGRKYEDYLKNSRRWI